MSPTGGSAADPARGPAEGSAAGSADGPAGGSGRGSAKGGRPAEGSADSPAAGGTASPAGGPVKGGAEARDPGLQPERTRLAWRRTTLSGSVVAVLGVKTALHGGASASGVVACALCCGLWLGFLLVAHRRIRVLAAGDVPPALVPVQATVAVLCTVAMAACGAVLVF